MDDPDQTSRGRSVVVERGGDLARQWVEVLEGVRSREVFRRGLSWSGYSDEGKTLKEIGNTGNDVGT